MQHDPRVRRKMWVGVGLSLLAVLGIWALQLRQTVWRTQPQNIGDGVRREWETAREEFGTIFEEEQPTPSSLIDQNSVLIKGGAGSADETLNRAAIERLSEELKTELP